MTPDTDRSTKAEELLVWEPTLNDAAALKLLKASGQSRMNGWILTKLLPITVPAAVICPGFRQIVFVNPPPPAAAEMMIWLPFVPDRVMFAPPWNWIVEPDADESPTTFPPSVCQLASAAAPGAAALRLRVSPALFEAVVPVKFVKASVGFPWEWFDWAAVVR